MNTNNEPFLTTRELADLLRIKERKVYELATHGDVPCVRVVGKLLFPRTEIMRWIDSARSGPLGASEASLPPTVLGSHDPLLDWALRESGSGLAAFFDGSRDGLKRFSQREGIACGTHVHEDAGWNVETVHAEFSEQPVVLVEFVRRKRGFIVAAGNPKGTSDIISVSNLRVARRQSGAASQQLFNHLLGNAGINESTLNWCNDCARTEDELGMQVFDGRVDVAFGLQSVAAVLRLDFIPVMEERFDLLVWRQAWFDTPFQTFLSFTQGQLFKDKADKLGGYDISSLGAVHYNAHP